ncbi:MAG: DUF748 domain-containing protein [Candidatus Omnitrophica bacterium]|nr:DUF748 domain-containing protein [Candidatus Omnitrophota bacterium]
MIKKILIALVILAIISAAAVYIYRQAIIQYYGEKFIRDNLPEYIKIDKIKFDLVNNVFSLGGLKILNPPGFLAKYLLAIEEVRCTYRIKGAIFPEGLDVTGISFKRPEISVERLPDGRMNLVEMDRFTKSFPVKNMPTGLSEEARKAITAIPSLAPQSVDKAKKLSDIIKLPPSFGIERGRIFFIDAAPYQKPYEITIDSVNGDVSISFNDNYSEILSVAFTLQGILNGAADQRLKWIASLDPRAPRLTMSNRFEVSNLDILTFEPYYYAHSPIVFKRGSFSGDLIFDFDNGNIGSTNEIRLSDISFFVKEGSETGQFFETSVPDLIRYFTTSSGDVVFDFKIKGGMNNLRFYLGPISKRALTSMALDKISSYAINQITKPADAVTGGTVDKAKDYINMFKELIKKK